MQPPKTTATRAGYHPAFEERNFNHVPQTPSVIELSSAPAHGTRVLNWLLATWRDDDHEFAPTMLPNHDRPGALIATIADSPVGVLAFKRYQATSQRKPELWINAVYVVPNRRRLGIGSRLVRTAITKAIPRFTNQLFVYTDVPTLYQKVGWEFLDATPSNGSHTLCFPAASNGTSSKPSAGHLLSPTGAKRMFAAAPTSCH